MVVYTTVTSLPMVIYMLFEQPMRSTASDGTGVCSVEANNAVYEDKLHHEGTTGGGDNAGRQLIKEYSDLNDGWRNFTRYLGKKLYVSQYLITWFVRRHACGRRLNTPLDLRADRSAGMWVDMCTDMYAQVSLHGMLEGSRHRPAASSQHAIFNT